MAKQMVEPFAYAPQTLQALANPGLLLVSRDGSGRPNAMTIGWGSLGIYWSRPVFVVPVRRSRYTHGCIEHTGDFTVNVLPARLAEVAAFCGSVSGRDHDKFAEARLTAAAASRVKSPLIEECVLGYECRLVHHNDLAPAALDGAIKQSAYAGGDYHTFFFGEILAVQAALDLAKLL